MSVVPKVLGFAVASALVALSLATRSNDGLSAATPAVLPPTEVAVLATARDADAETTEVRFVRIDAGVATFKRIGAVALPRGGVARGDVVPGTRAVVVVADDAQPGGHGARASDFAATLYGADEVRGVRPLVRGVLHASRPLASVDGAVYVERGAPGADVSEGEAQSGRLRVDALAIDAVDRATGAVRTVYTWSGYTLHLAGELDGELLVYRVGPALGEIIAVERVSGRSRVVSAVPPFARDFTVDFARRALVMSNRDDADARAWNVERVDLASGLRTKLVTARGEAPAPFALADGTLAWSARHTAGASLTFGTTAYASARGATTTPIARRIAPLGPGLDAVAALADDGAWALIAHEGADGAETLAALHAPSARAVQLASEAERLDAVGFVGGARVALR